MRFICGERRGYRMIYYKAVFVSVIRLLLDLSQWLLFKNEVRVGGSTFFNWMDMATALEVKVDFSSTPFSHPVFAIAKNDYVINSEYPQLPNLHFSFKNSGILEICLDILPEVDEDGLLSDNNQYLNTFNNSIQINEHDDDDDVDDEMKYNVESRNVDFMGELVYILNSIYDFYCIIIMNFMKLLRCSYKLIHEFFYLKNKKQLNNFRSTDNLLSYKHRESFNISNLYILVMTDKQWDMFSETDNRIVSTISSMGYVWDTYVKCYKRLPIVDYKTRHRIIINEDIRLAVLLFNAYGTSFKFKSYVRFLNMDSHHLSSEQIFIPLTVFWIMIIYFVTSVAATVTVFTIWRNKMNILHIVICINLFIFFLLYLLDYLNCYFLQTMGSRQLVVWYISQVFRKFVDTASLITFLLIALGYRILRRNLSRLEMQACLAISIISFYLGLFEIFSERFQASRYILHAIGYLVILIASNFNGAVLFSQLRDESLNMTTGELYFKYRTYRIFRWVFLFFLMKPMILVFYKFSLLQPIYNHISLNSEHTFILVDALFDLFLFLLVFIIFQPPRAMRIFKACE